MAVQIPILAPDLRPLQQQLFDARARFNVWVCHRRFGKTVLCLYALLDDALLNQRVRPRYAYIAPIYKQAKAVVWDYLKALAATVRAFVPNEAELRLDLPNGGRIQLFGADNPDALRGMYLDGVVFDEYAQIRPRTWAEVVRPALTDRQGWAVFIGTPMGHNHFYDLYNQAQTADGWHTACYKASDTGILPQDELDAARAVMSPEQYAQEFECSFESALIGAYYASYLETARAEDRITRVPHDPSVPVHVSFDIGVSDSTAIWFVQPVHRMLHVIDYLEASDQGIAYYAKVLKDKPYTYGRFYFPFDMRERDFSADGRSRLAIAESLGLKPAVLVKQTSIADGINAVRTLFPRFVFDKDKCHEGLQALAAYRRQWNEQKKDWESHPYHDFSSHAADSLRYFATAYSDDPVPVAVPAFPQGPPWARESYWRRR